MSRLRIATRASVLARYQAELVRGRLQAAGAETELVLVKTEGDTSQAPFAALEGVGFFVKELEAALLRGEADLAVHSLKDLPTRLPDGLVLGAALERADPRDVLVSPGGVGLEGLKQGARVGTASPRRVAQLKRLRPDLASEPVRGNVDTRLRKLLDGQVDALVLARAGLERLGRLGPECHVLDSSRMVPAACQGAIGVECRERDAGLRELLTDLEHAATRREVEAERAFIATLGGGCQAPIGVLARTDGAELGLEAAIVSLDGRDNVHLRGGGPAEDAADLGRRLAEEAVGRGARTILEAARAPRAGET